MAQYFVAAFTVSIVGGVYIKLWKYNHWSKLGLKTLNASLPFGYANKFIFKKVNVSEEFKKTYDEIKASSGRHAGTYFLTTPVYIPVDPAIVKSILSSDNFSERNIYTNKNKDKLYNSVFYATLDEAKTCREKLSSLNSKESKETYLQTLAKVVQTIPDTLKEEVNTVEFLNKINAAIVQQLFLNEAIFTSSVDDLEKKLNNFSSPQEYFGIKSTLALISSSVLKIFFARISNKNATNYFANEVEKVVNFRKEAGSKGDFLDVLINVTEDSGAISNILTMILGNCKFVVSTISCCLYEVAKNPEIQEKLREEMKRVLVKCDNKISLDVLKELEYLDAVIKETLRKYPVVPIIKRSNKSVFVIPQSVVQLSANTDIIIPVSGLHNDPDYFEKPEEFNPERFSSSNVEKIQEFTYIPFGYGNRDCIGREFSQIQMKLILLTLVADYEISLKNDADIEFLPNCLYNIPKELFITTKKI